MFTTQNCLLLLLVIDLQAKVDETYEAIVNSFKWKNGKLVTFWDSNFFLFFSSWIDMLYIKFYFFYGEYSCIIIFQSKAIINFQSYINDLILKQL